MPCFTDPRRDGEEHKLPCRYLFLLFNRNRSKKSPCSFLQQAAQQTCWSGKQLTHCQGSRRTALMTATAEQPPVSPLLLWSQRKTEAGAAHPSGHGSQRGGGTHRSSSLMCSEHQADMDARWLRPSSQSLADKLCSVREETLQRPFGHSKMFCYASSQVGLPWLFLQLFPHTSRTPKR